MKSLRNWELSLKSLLKNFSTDTWLRPNRSMKMSREFGPRYMRSNREATSMCMPRERKSLLIEFSRRRLHLNSKLSILKWRTARDKWSSKRNGEPLAIKISSLTFLLLDSKKKSNSSLRGRHSSSQGLKTLRDRKHMGWDSLLFQNKCLMRRLRMLGQLHKLHNHQDTLPRQTLNVKLKLRVTHHNLGQQSKRVKDPTRVWREDILLQRKQLLRRN